ncbi:MAG: sugar ABC transporter permease [Catenulispora sp.]|nr:sugar ABC transporter permease [Catenulispora sp.]
MFVSPAFLLLFAFGVLPIGLAALVSFTDLNVAGLGDLSQVHWVGFDNFSTLLAADSDFWPALGNTALFIVMGVPVIVVVSLAVAIGLNRSRNRLFRALRAFYFVPAVTGIVAVSLVFANLYNSQFGLLNHLLDSVGLPTVPWLADPTWAKVSVALVAVWRALGLNVIILLAAQQDIPREYYEAASLDGAGQARQAFSITIPLLRFALFFVTVTTLINWMQFFDEPFVLTGGGPVGATTSASLYIYKEGFESDRFGFASAASLVLFVLIFAVTAFQLWLARRAGERR